ncbi:MAG TPA: Ig-like domain-containing protein, partial [Ilumatobacteraceae bacterium]
MLSNDDDPNCEPIAVVELIPASDPWGQITIIDNGQHLLYSPSSEWQGKSEAGVQMFAFDYVVADIDGNRSDPATVTVRVKPYDDNSPPELRRKLDGTTREMRTVVEEGQQVEYDVMADWFDPDGDDLRLESAVAIRAGETVASSRGLVQYRARGVTPGDQKVAITVSDGSARTTEEMTVTVHPDGSKLEPITSDDFVQVAEGATVTLFPLANDSDPNEDRIDLIPGWSSDGVGFAAGHDPATNAVEILGIEAGVYRLPYEASDGIETTPATIRLEVLAADDVNDAPVAVPDRVSIRPNRVINVDVLSNDVDPDGDLLAVVDVASTRLVDAEQGGVRATAVDRRMVQLEVVAGSTGEPPTGPFTVSYVVRDGHEVERLELPEADKRAAELQAKGSITVLVQPDVIDQPPVTEPDSAVVRSGDVVAIPVLRNDSDPDGDQLVLLPLSAEAEAAFASSGAGFAWTEGRFLYVQGGAPTTQPASITYSVQAGDIVATGEARVTVKPDVNTNPNNPPQAPTLELRAIRNSDMRVKVPLSGVDPDGDSVSLESASLVGDGPA